ncbi:MAG: acyl-CoA thioesterase [Burkholderiales bacterium]|nr:acyl-CoA thioesterase [Burkholderiales bacterium]
MNREDFTLVHRLRVRWVEVDMQHVVYNANYLMYFDVAFAEYWRAMAQGAAHEFHDDYMKLYAAKASLEYLGSAHYDEEIDVGCRVARLGRSSMTFQFGIWRGADQLVTGELVYVYVDPATKKGAPIPERLRGAMVAYERVKPEA